MKKSIIFLLLFAAFNANAQESFFKGNNNYQAPIIFAPTISATTVVSNISRYGASSGGTITNNGGAIIIASGICWSSISNTPTISDSKTTDGTGIGTFTSSLNGLTAGVTYHVRSYATNSVGTSYGTVQTFMTTSISPSISTPVLTTISPASSIGTTSAVVGGNITDEGLTQVSARGIVYGTTAGSSTYTLTTGSGAGTFTTTLTGLTAGTRYFVRSFATNVQGTAYGAEINFTTLTTPTVSVTATITSITGSTATGGGTISADGGASVLARGLVWGTTSGSSTFSTTTGSGTGTYTSSLNSLSNGTTYFVRAFATNSVGTSYGPELSFATPSTATMSSTITSTITSASAVLGGALSSTGNATTTVGVMYSTASNFGTYSTTTINTNASVGTYATTITGLSQLTTYFAKTFATNIVGTTYGPTINFTTPVAPIAVGDFYGGGVVFYILQPGDNGYVNGETHGLIAVKTNVLPDERNTSGTPNPVLYNQVALNGNAITGAQNDGTLIGRSNTAAIIANQGAGTYVFKYVNSTPISGYSDWYVPSKTELILFRNFLFSGSANITPGSRFREDRVGAYLWVNNSDATNKYAWGNYVSSTQVSASSQSAAYRYRYATYYLEVVNQISAITHNGFAGFYANFSQQNMVILPIRSF